MAAMILRIAVDITSDSIVIRSTLFATAAILQRNVDAGYLLHHNSVSRSLDRWTCGQTYSLLLERITPARLPAEDRTGDWVNIADVRQQLNVLIYDWELCHSVWWWEIGEWMNDATLGPVCAATIYRILSTDWVTDPTVRQLLPASVMTPTINSLIGSPVTANTCFIRSSLLSVNSTTVSVKRSHN